MNLYHFILDHRVGGPHVYVESLCSGMKGRVVSVTVTTGRGPMTDYELINIRHYWGPLYLLEVALNITVIFCWAVFGRIKIRDSVFAVHGAHNLAPLVAARLLAIPVAWHFHEALPRFLSLVSIGKWVLKGSVHSLAVVANKSNEVFDLKDTIFLPAAVNTKFWNNSNVTKEEVQVCGWSAPSCIAMPPLRILAVSNINPLKGIDVLLVALKSFQMPFQLKIVGSQLETHKEYVNMLRGLADEITTQRRYAQIEFLGWQDKNRVRALLASCDVFVLPSRSEAWPIALLEAMSMGCRCVASDVGDVKLMLEGYMLGAVFPVGSAEACGARILEVVRMLNPSGAYSNESVASKWKLDELVIRAESMYQALLKRKKNAD